MRAWKDELLQQRKGTIQKKMAKAEERRQLQIRIKAQKAHEEEAKVSQGSHIHVEGHTKVSQGSHKGQSGVTQRGPRSVRGHIYMRWSYIGD